MNFISTVKPLHSDGRGTITQLLNRSTHKIISALLITCKKNSVRANHYHKKDCHYVFMLRGRMEYYYRNLTIPNAKKRMILVKKGQVIYTPAMFAHSMKFIENSIFLALSTEKRNQKNYESDTVKIKLI